MILRPDIEQNDRIAPRYSSAVQCVRDQPITFPLGPDSEFTINIPTTSSETVLSSTCGISFHILSPRAILAPSAIGIDIPTMNKNAGKTRSTNVIPLPLKLSL